MNSQNKTKKQPLKRFWNWIKITSLLLGLICSGVLVYQWWSKKQELKQLWTQLEKERKEAQKQYEIQQKHLISLNSLVNNPQVKDFFTDLLKKYSEQFAKYDAKLAKEHEEFTREIYGIIKNLEEYSEWEERWKQI